MDTIKNYLDNVFSGLPETEEILSIKQDVFLNMEEKFYDLLENGYSRNEAIGKVIAEFGDIDELIEELGIDSNSSKATGRKVTKNEALNYLEAKRLSGLKIAIGVFLIIMSVNFVILFSQLADSNFLGFNSDSFGVIPMFFMIAIAVGLFIYSGQDVKNFEYLKQGFILDSSLRSSLKIQEEEFTKTHTLMITIGVILCILAPIPIIFFDMLEGSFFFSIFRGIPLLSLESGSSGIVMMFTLISIATFMFIYFGSIKEGYNLLLKKEEYSYIDESGNVHKAVKIFEAFIWPLATIAFFIAGFLFHLWHIAWIVFPIAALLQAMFNGVHAALNDK